MHKSTDVYLGYAIVALMFVLAAPVQADFQCDQQGKDIHAPYDADDTDNELYLTPAVMPNFQVGGTQTCEGKQDFSVAVSTVPDALQSLISLRSGQCIRFGSADAPRDYCAFYEVEGETCTITDVNGDTRQVETFSSTFIKMPVSNETRIEQLNGGRQFAFRVKVFCSDY